MKIVVTGAAGFVGRHLVRRLAGSHEVHAVARSAADVPGVRWILHDLTRPLDGAALPERVDAVVHLAQSRHFRAFPAQASDIFAVNVASTAALLAYAHRAGATRFVHASTGGVYGGGPRPFGEDDPPARGLGFYPASKLAAELLVEGWRSLFATTRVRFFFVYGAGQDASMLMPRLVRTVRVGDSVGLNGADGIRINPVHVSDAVEALERLLGAGGPEVLNVGGGEVVTLRGIAEAIGRQLGREPRFRSLDGPPVDLVGDVGRLQALAGPPRVDLRAGLAELCAAEGDA